MSRLFTICCSSWAAIIPSFRGTSEEGPGGPLPLTARLLPGLPGGEGPDDILGRRLERPHRDVLLVLDLDQRAGGVDVLLGLRVELDPLPRVDHLVAGDVRLAERLHDALGYGALRPVDRLGEDERGHEAPRRVLAHLEPELFLEEVGNLADA